MLDRSAELVPEDETLKGGSYPVLENPKPHVVFGMPVTGPWENGQEIVYIDIGCYWSAKKLLWEAPSVLSTSIGSVGGMTPNPTYCEPCTGHANRTEIVEVIYNPKQISFSQPIVKAFEAHDPAQGYRQGNDVGTQHRPTAYTMTPEQTRRVQGIADAYAPELADAGLGATTTETKPLSETPAGEYYRTEDEYQQYLFKNPNGYCPMHSTGMACGI